MVTSLLNRCLGNKIQILDVNSPDFYRVGIVLLSNDNQPCINRNPAFVHPSHVFFGFLRRTLPGTEDTGKRNLEEGGGSPSCFVETISYLSLLQLAIFFNVNPSRAKQCRDGPFYRQPLVGHSPEATSSRL